MQRSFEHQSREFAISSQFESFSALKDACTHAALLDVYEFVPDKVDTDRYTLKCKAKECIRYLYATAVHDMDDRQIRKSIQVHSCDGINHSGPCKVEEGLVAI